MNKVILTGNLVKDITNQSTADGTAVVSNTIAVKRDRKNENGEYLTDFINFVAWRTNAEYLRQYAQKGDRLEIVGSWQVRQYVDSRGENRTVNELIVESLSVYSKKEKNDSKEGKLPSYKDARNTINQNDLPF